MRSCKHGYADRQQCDWCNQRMSRGDLSLTLLAAALVVAVVVMWVIMLSNPI